MAETIINEFTVNRPIDEAWPVLCDLERIAPCLPGAQLQEIEGDTFRGVVKIKLGAVNANFKGEARFVERDDTAHRAVLSASGRDTGGRGNASADVTAEAIALSPTSTRCTVTAELHITGKVAQFGRGIMGDVSKKLINQFATNLNTMLDESGSAAEPAPEPVAATSAEPATSAASEAGATEAPAATTPPPAAEPTVRKINGPANEPIELTDVAGSAVLKRALPFIGGLVLLLLVLRFRRR